MGSKRATGTLMLLAAVFVLLLQAAGVAATGPAEIKDGVEIRETVPTVANRPAPVLYTFKAAEPCIMEMTVGVTPNTKQAYAPMLIQIVSGRQVVFVYRLDCNIERYLFFPVFDAGTYQVVVRGYVAGTEFSLRMRSIKPEVTEQEKAAALKAIERGTASLLSKTPATAREAPTLAVAVESLVMDALASDRSGANYEVIEKDYLPWLKEQFHEVPTVQWNGKTVSGITRSGSPMYCHAIATLALAEMAPHSPAAKELAEKGASYLLASQLTDRRPAAWRAVLPANANFGGWRYVPNAMDADLSVSGWCVVALNACAVADIQPEGMREGLKDAVGFVKRTKAPGGFGYYAGGSGGAATIRNTIGALVFSLYGEHGREYDAAMASLDRHLYPGTQTDDIQDYPLYFAYYATRLNYLRGSAAWEAWRMSAIRQLLKLQRPDGSWPSERTEIEAGPQRYATAISILILRMCLDDEPAYMTQEVRGF